MAKSNTILGLPIWMYVIAAAGWMMMMMNGRISAWGLNGTASVENLTNTSDVLTNLTQGPTLIPIINNTNIDKNETGLDIFDTDELNLDFDLTI